MDRPKLTLVPIWLAIAAVSSGAWATPALAQTDEGRRPSCVTRDGEPCCTPAQGADDEEGLSDDCPPAGRQHREGGGDGRGVRVSDDDSADDGEGDDGEGDDGDGTGSSNFGHRSGRASGSSRKTTSGAPASGTSGEAPVGGTPSGAPAGSGEPGGTPTAEPVSNPVSAPGSVAGGTPAATPGPVATSSPGTSTAAGSAATAPNGAANAGQPNRVVANTGADVGTPLSVAMMLLMVGTTLRRATRQRPPRRPTTLRNRPPRRPPSPAPPGWSYVDHSSAARAIEKF